jgi:Asp-tRNA(Asn)/Glu-tRNA(Gln) amidotransferase A subunit family amidase
VGNSGELHEFSLTELVSAIRKREVSPVEVTEHYLRRAEERNEQIGAFFNIAADQALDQARAAEEELLAPGNEERPLLGVPIPVKDLNFVEGMPITLGSKVFEGFVAPMDDYVAQAIRGSGAVIMGKTATPEFGLPCYTETSVGPPARTPWDLSRSAGGSSGGAAAAVAAGLAPVAQGSDGGGSIRIPSSVCGVFGIKPTRGRVSGGPVVPDLSGLAINGPIARTVADAALLLDVLAGNHPGDMYTLPAPDEPFASHAKQDPPRLKIARTLSHPVEGAEVHPDCVKAYEDASQLLASLGHEVIDVPSPFDPASVPHFETLWYTMSTLTPIAPEQESLLRPLTRYLRERGEKLTANQLIAAQAALQATTRQALATLEQYDALLTPTLAQPPVPVGWFEDQSPEVNFARQKAFTPYTAVFNVSGQPAVNVPLYWNADNLPIGIMLAGRQADESTLIRLSAQLEQARPWRDRHPAIWLEYIP